ncbi:ubiquitin-like small modifier protein 1 [Halobaculum gomorrense]|uniref:Ubiquitin-like small archaeal modifier protein (SAMP) n=1 Tax=Halobaculum gomorrense TaxID=43928 RepID=A0A1M5TMG8_9EURY|nr:ubiquitin-like small modifier protein 1 [Halobaculum gomorrense]SHH51982.1 ubiquitin-like small archaeal modifier protein (SAMP) [Halobaculum gomorrense]
MNWKLFADLAEATGESEPEVDAADAATVGEALDALLDAHPALAARVLDDDGDLRGHINLLRNGRDIREGEGLATPVDEDDELALFPPVSGG